MPWTLTRLRLLAGRWEGRLAGPAGEAPPALAAKWRGEEIAEARIAPDGEGTWLVAIDLPPAIISDGTHMLAVGPRGGDPLCRETLGFGDPLEADLRAEIAALRTELDVLGRALRRHLAEGG